MSAVPVALATSIDANRSNTSSTSAVSSICPAADEQVPVGELIVRGAVQVDIDDSADIGWYDADRIDFGGAASRSCQPELPAGAASRAVPRSNFPLEITIQVEKLDVEPGQAQECT